MSKIWFTFDDSNTSDIWCGQVLHSLGLVGAFFLCDSVDLSQQVDGLLRLGMVVGNHTEKHLNIASKSEQTVLDAVMPFNERLKKSGASGDYFSYPFSSGRSGVIDRNFKYIYRGCHEPTEFSGEISRVSIFKQGEEKGGKWIAGPKKSDDELMRSTLPLQLHAIPNCEREWFLKMARAYAERTK